MSKSRDLADLLADGAITADELDIGQIGGRRNLIINGAMQVAQRGTSATVSDGSNEGYSTLDRWRVNMNNAISGAVAFSQSSDAPNGFSNSAKIQCSTANTSLSANQYVALGQRLEAQDLQQLAYGTSDAKSMVLSWYMKAENFSGPISVGIETGDGTIEFFVKSVTPTSSWAKYSITVPASTTATINSDNGLGLEIEFVLAGDSDNTSFDRSTDSTAWETTRYEYVSGVGNILSSTSNAIYITGVQLEVGTVATPFEHRSYGEELALCQRYFYSHLSAPVGNQAAICTSANYSTTKSYGTVSFPIIMRAAPSLNAYSAADAWYVYYGNTFDTFDTLQQINVTPSTTMVVNSDNVSVTQGHAANLQVNDTTNCYVHFDAEL